MRDKMKTQLIYFSEKSTKNKLKWVTERMLRRYFFLFKSKAERMYFSLNNCKLMQKWYFLLNVTGLQQCSKHWYYCHVQSHPPSPPCNKTLTIYCQDASLACLWLQRSIVSTWQWLNLHPRSLWFPRALQSLHTVWSFPVSIETLCKYLQRINLIDLILQKMWLKRLPSSIWSCRRETSLRKAMKRRKQNFWLLF